MRNFPISWVIEQDLPLAKKKKTATGFEMDCPFCSKKMKFDVNTSKNLARCNACGRGFNSLTLHANLVNTSNKKAYKDLWDRYNGLSSELKTELDNYVPQTAEIKPEPLWIRDLVYRAFLSKLTLKKEHLANLLDRGLSLERIKELNYKSVPETELDCTDIIDYLKANNEKANKYLQRHKNINIAGFEWQNDRFFATRRKSGFLIPIIVKCPAEFDSVFDHDFQGENLISGFQIRYDKGEKRYSYYASEGSFTGYENVHFRIPDAVVYDTENFYLKRPILKRVVLTEGCLKSDVASFLSADMPFIAVLGVNNQRCLDDALKLLKDNYCTEEIILAFDQDYIDNKNVESALDKAREKIISCGMRVYDCKWLEEYKENNVKGIDDLLLFRAKQSKNSATSTNDAALCLKY